METYHWLPQDIAKIPYKKLQELMFIKRQISINQETKVNIKKAENEHSVSSGQGKRIVRTL
jgi:hypothetical protein